MSNENKPITELTFNIKGVIEKDDTGKIGTLSPAEGSTQEPVYMTFTEFKRLQKNTPDLLKRWTDGLLVEMPQTFANASFKVTYAKVKVEER